MTTPAPAATAYLHASQLQQPLSAGGIALDDPASWVGFQRVQLMEGDTYRDQSTVMVVPSREQFVHWRVAESWRTLVHPMNQKCHLIFCHGDEVGHAYNRMIAEILAHPELGRWKYVMTMETDNIQPWDAHLKLLETIDRGKYDGVSGLYWTKGEVNNPMAYGNPAEYAAGGDLDFRPRVVRECLEAGAVMEVNGIAMGCSLYRMDLFREVEQPWFVTVAEVTEGKGAIGFSQDLFFCKQAKAKGKRFAVDMRVKVGHMDLQTGVMY